MMKKEKCTIINYFLKTKNKWPEFKQTMQQPFWLFEYCSPIPGYRMSIDWKGPLCCVSTGL